MTDSNPYAAPRAAVRDPGSARGRPAWVWVISIFYVFSAISTAVSYYFLYSGKIDIPEDQRRYLASLTALDHALTFVIASVNLLAAVQLFRLRKISAVLFPSGFALGLAVTAWHAASKGWYTAVQHNGFAGMLIGWGIAAAVCLYAWRLARAGVLK